MAKRPPGLGDAPIQPELHATMNALGRVLDETLNGEKKGEAREWGFVLICFPFTEAEAAKDGGQGRANYISNARREEVVIMLKEQLRRFEGQPDVKGRA
jgi:hypothetical protein